MLSTLNILQDTTRPASRLNSLDDESANIFQNKLAHKAPLCQALLYVCVCVSHYPSFVSAPLLPVANWWFRTHCSVKRTGKLPAPWLAKYPIYFASCFDVLCYYRFILRAASVCVCLLVCTFLVFYRISTAAVTKHTWKMRYLVGMLQHQFKHRTERNQCYSAVDV